MIADPPVAGADHDTVSCWCPDTSLGASALAGAVAAGVALVVSDHAPAPTAFTARTCTQYSVLFVKDEITCVKAPPPVVHTDNTSVQVLPSVLWRRS